MQREEILASVSVLVLSGVLVYLTKVGAITIGKIGQKSNRITANQSIASAAINANDGDASGFVYGPSIYVANQPWPFGANVGNTLPPTSAGVTLPGASQADFLGFATA